MCLVKIFYFLHYCKEEAEAYFNSTLFGMTLEVTLKNGEDTFISFKILKDQKLVQKQTVTLYKSPNTYSYSEATITRPWHYHVGTTPTSCTIMTSSWFETTLDYNPQFFIKEFPCLVHKLFVTLPALHYKPQWKMGQRIYKPWLIMACVGYINMKEIKVSHPMPNRVNFIKCIRYIVQCSSIYYLD